LTAPHLHHLPHEFNSLQQKSQVLDVLLHVLSRIVVSGLFPFSTSGERSSKVERHRLILKIKLNEEFSAVLPVTVDVYVPINLLIVFYSLIEL